MPSVIKVNYSYAFTLNILCSLYVYFSLFHCIFDVNAVRIRLKQTLWSDLQ